MLERTLFEDEHVWFRESVASFLDKEVLPHRDEDRAAKRIPREVWRKAGELGFLGLGVAARYGGSDIEDYRFNAVLGEELARMGVAYTSCFGIQVDVVAPYLTRLTSEEQKERWLPGFCSGEIVTALAMTEPEAGSDVQGLRTRAVRDGDGWVINGSKTFITNGASCDLAVIAAKTATDPKGRGITLFGVDWGMEGFTRGQKLHKIGQHEADTAELFFEDVRVGPEHVIGEVDGGFAHMVDHLAQERLHTAVVNLAHAAHVIALTLTYVKDRKAFGRPIGTFQSNRFTMAELVTKVDVTRAYVDRCIEAHVAGGLSAVDAAKAKWWVADVQNEVTDACVQLHGGYGYMEEYEVARAWADARVTRIYAGSNEIMKEIIGRDLGLGDPR